MTDQRPHPDLPTPAEPHHPHRAAFARFARRASPFLLIGMVVTVLVAWSVPLWPPTSWTFSSEGEELAWIARHKFHVDVPERWPDWIPDDWPAPTYAGGMIFRGSRHIEFGARDPSHQRVDNKIIPPYQPGDTVVFRFIRSEQGWPFMALSSDHYLRLTFTGGPFGHHAIDRPGPFGALDRGITIPWGQTQGLVLAIYPVLPGFLINMFFYTLLAWLPFGAFGFTRRTLRRRAGRCVACGYELAALEACPECGRATAERAAPTG